MFIYRLMTISDDFVAIIAVIIAFVLSACFAIVAHEVSHAWVAKLNGDYTAENAGRLTLNPVAHFDPIGLQQFYQIPPRHDNGCRRRGYRQSVACGNFPVVAVLASTAFAVCRVNIDGDIFFADTRSLSDKPQHHVQFHACSVQSSSDLSAGRL